MRIANLRAQAGVGLIEVLISLVVLSIGMLGLAGLQIYSLRSNQGAMERSMAVVETHSIVDAMRADRAAALAGEFNIDTADSDELTGDTFAERAVQTWQENLLKTLGPGASGVINCASTVCTITVRWPDQQPVGSTARRQPTSQQQVTTEVQL